MGFWSWLLGVRGCSCYLQMYVTVKLSVSPSYPLANMSHFFAFFTHPNENMELRVSLRVMI